MDIPSKEELELDEKADQPMELYTEEHFKQYVKEKYEVKSASYIENPKLLKLVYALEWFDVKKNDLTTLVKFHPSITVADYQKIDNIDSQNFIDCWIGFGASFLLTNRLLTSRINRRVFRYPSAVAWSAVFTYGISYFVLSYIVKNEIKKQDLDKYLELHYDAAAIRADLEKIGIYIKVKYYNEEEVQNQVEQASKSKSE